MDIGSIGPLEALVLLAAGGAVVAAVAAVVAAVAWAMGHRARP